jgi:hypothetical protein
MGATIPDGQYYGEVTRTQRVTDLVLSETRYARGAIVPRHSHASPLLCLVVSGRFVERSRVRTRTPGPGWVLLHPEDEPHAHRFEVGANPLLHGSARTRLAGLGCPGTAAPWGAEGGAGRTACVDGAAALRRVHPR